MKHDTQCDTLDSVIKGKPCNCRQLCPDCGLMQPRGAVPCGSD